MLDSLNSDELCEKYLQEVKRLYGDKRANKSHAYYVLGWFYINLARRFSDGSIGCGGHLPTPYRKKEVIKLIACLREREKKGE